METYEIKKGTRTGTVFFNPENNKFLITFPVPSVKKQIKEYLTTKQTFRIPQSDVIDDFKEVETLPTQDKNFFDMAMCGLHTDAGVLVDFK